MDFKTGIRLIDLLKRPEINYESLKNVDVGRPTLDENIFTEVEIEVKYEGYIKKQQAQVAEMQRLESKKLPFDVDYKSVTGLRLEAAEKLNLIKPRDIGQASRISGVSPADVSVLIIWLAKNAKN